MHPWIELDLLYRDPLDPVWGSTFGSLADDGGIPAHQWLNLDTGVRILLAAEGSWKTGGIFRVFYKHPADPSIIEITAVVTEADAGIRPHPLRFDQGEPFHWEAVQRRYVRTMMRELFEV